MMIPKLKESNYFDDNIEMHYALLQSAEKVGPHRHTHDFFEIFLITEGQIKHIVNGRTMLLLAGSMTLIRPNDAHYYRPSNGHDCQVINLAVARRAVYELFAYLGDGFRTAPILEALLPPTVNLSPASKAYLIAKLEKLNSIPAGNLAEKRTALRMLLFEMMTQYFPLVTEAAENGMPAWLQNTCKEMQRPENFAKGVPRMLELSAVSAEHLSRTVRKYLQQTPTSYVNQLRLTYSANLLAHGDKEIVEIVAEAGFQSLSYFYALFKAHFGQTPRSFRHNHRPQLLHGSA